MCRLFIFRELAINDQVVISGEDAHHIIRVLRYRSGDVIRISDGANTESLGVIIDIDTRDIEIKLKIVEKNKLKGITPLITLIQGLPKGEKFDWILQKNTEIGVCKFIPIVTQRTVVKLIPSKIERRKKRWEKIVKAAAKQCMRMDIPKIDQVLTFDSSLQEIKNHQLSIIPWEQEKVTTLKKIMQDIDKNILRIAVFIGPEGGFSIDEIKKAKAAGAVPVSLGSRILKTETAAVAACSMIMYELGDMGGQ
ncbi:MAG TPA: 16S rRNA (uracil(1498)-N(3))-methyltransferase [Thermoanaerobacterales bacterium]|nr:16S rRNA (uracil(1498)-N(3))-methyltransferase [Thermoanaerobacterales bacterium]